MTSTETDLSTYLEPTPFIESSDETVLALAKSLEGEGPQATATALFDWVRDHIRYDPLAAMDAREQYRASAVLERRSGYCVQKAVLLAALCRAVGIPARLGFADVRNHRSPPRMRELMGTDLYVFHGYVELYLDGSWVKATPAFDDETSRKVGVLPVSLGGEGDAMLHPVDPKGHPSIEYVRSRGSYADLPFDELRQTLVETYPSKGAG